MSELGKRVIETLSNLFEAEREIERELSERGHKLLRQPKQGGFEDMSTAYLGEIVGCEWLRIQDTQGTLYIFKQTGGSSHPESQELIYAEDMQTGNSVGRGSTELMCDAVELMRKHMVLDDLAGA